MSSGAAVTAASETRHLFALTVIVGCVCGVVAVAFQATIHWLETLLIDRATHAHGSTWIFWTIVTPAVGGLLAGVALTWLVPNARGSGIPQVKQALASAAGQVPFRDAVGKFLIGAVQIGSGASLGREGPLVQISAGTASALGRITALPPRSVKRLTPVGVAAGFAASFNAPIAAVAFTLEEIVGTLDKATLGGAIVAAGLAVAVGRELLGVQVLLVLQHAQGQIQPASLPSYLALGLVAALVSVAFTRSLLRARLFFRTWHTLPHWTHPAVGGFATGVLAVIALYYFNSTGITGGGRPALSSVVDGRLGFNAIAALLVMKAVATLLSFSSGGAGGIFTPTLLLGALLGSTVGHFDAWMLGSNESHVGAFALLGMGALFAGVIRAPVTSVLLIIEMTGNYQLVPPLLLINTTAFLLARRLCPLPIYDALLAQDSQVVTGGLPTR